MTFEMFFGVLLAVVISQSFAYRHYYMDQMCGKVMELTKLQSAGILTLTRLWRYKHNMDCTITITAPPHNRVLIRIIKVDIDEDKYRCNDWVQIYDGNKLKSSPTALTARLCGEAVPSQAFSSSGRDMSIKFVSNHYDNDIGFDLVFNSFDMEPCDGGEFTCDNGRCITKRLKCARYDNCGDFSNTCRSHTWIIFSAVLGSLAVIAVILLGVFLVQHSRYKTRLVVVSSAPAHPDQPAPATQPMLPQHQLQPPSQLQPHT